jgi:hypothetical protein
VLRIWPQFGNETALFICSCFAVIPLAGWMGRATEELAEHLGHGIGGLLNATFGNAAELIIALLALSKGLTGVVKASITGSIIARQGFGSSFGNILKFAFGLKNMVRHIFWPNTKQSDPRKEAVGARARNAVEDLNRGHRRAALGAGRLSHRWGVALSDTQPLGILREVLGQRIHRRSKLVIGALIQWKPHCFIGLALIGKKKDFLFRWLIAQFGDE